MPKFFRVFCLLPTAFFAGCNSSVRELDFINKQFLVTYNLDSTRTIDSTKLATFRNAKAIYNFSEGGKGTTHIQMGMVSNDIPFTWKLKNDSLSIDQAIYSVRRQDKGFILVNDSVKLMFSQQP